MIQLDIVDIKIYQKSTAFVLSESTNNRDKWKQIIIQFYKYHITDKHKVIREHSNRMIIQFERKKLGKYTLTSTEEFKKDSRN